MKTTTGWMAGALSALTLAACVTKQSTPDTVAAAPAAATPIVSGTLAENTVNLEATVEAVDLKNRTVTLRGADGKPVTVHVDERVKNLPQVKKGDSVVVTYFESLMYDVNRPGEGQPGVAVAQDVQTAKPGERPAAVGARAITVTATIEAIDSKAQTVTLKGPDGELTTVKARDPSRLAKVKVGDLVNITYAQALAVAVEPAAKK